MTNFIQLVFTGLAVGCNYALIAIGFTIIFKASQAINFAQGEFLLVGAFVASVAMFTWHLNFFVAVLIGMAVAAAIGVLFERVALRRMIGRPPFVIIMITIGLNVLLTTAVAILLSNMHVEFLRPPAPFDFVGSFQVGQITLLYNYLATIGATVLVCALLYAFFRFTRYGLAMRATAIDQEAALAVGIKLSTVYALAWAIAGATATIGGVFLAASQPTFDQSLGNTALVAFPAIILGGLDSIVGAVVGGIAIGVIYELAQGYSPASLGTGFDVIVPYLAMILVLLVRPYGLFGSRKVERI